MRRTTQQAVARVSPSPGRASSTSAGDAAKKLGFTPGSLKGLGRGELVYVCTIFAITGSSSAFLVRPALKWTLANTSAGLGFANLIGIKDPAAATLFGGPLQYSLMYLMVMIPMYSVLLFTFGTLAGRGLFFRYFIVKMWGRMLPKSVHQKLTRALVGAP